MIIQAIDIFQANYLHIGQSFDSVMKKFILIFLFSISIIAQQIKFYGEAKPASLVIGNTDSIKSIFLNNQKIKFNDDGYFVFAFDKEDDGDFELTIQHRNNKTDRFNYSFMKQEYENQELTLSKKMVNPPTKYLNRIKNESHQIKEARKKLLQNNHTYYLSGFTLPVKNVRITSQFGLNRILNGKPKNFHNGIDFGGSTGDSVFAIADSKVLFVGNNFYYNGNFILLDHGQGLNSIYLHLSKILVKKNQIVKKGDLIGLIGATGRSTGPHLHLGIQWFNKRIDPMNLFNLKFE